MELKLRSLMIVNIDHEVSEILYKVIREVSPWNDNGVIDEMLFEDKYLGTCEVETSFIYANIQCRCSDWDSAAVYQG